MSEKPSLNRREGVTSALEELALATNGIDALEPGAQRPVVQTPVVTHTQQPRVSALAEHAESISVHDSMSMSPEEQQVYQKGITKKRRTTPVPELQANAAEPIDISDATPSEVRAALKRSIEIERARVGSTDPAAAETLQRHDVLNRLTNGPVLQARSERAKEAYFQALRAHQRNRSFSDAGSERLGFKKASENEGSSTLRALKRGWLEARADVARARLESVVKEREQRDALNPNRTKLNSDTVLARFQRRYVIKEAVLGAAAEEARIRAEALNSRDRNVYEWTVKAYSELPEGIKDVVSQIGLGVGVVGVSAGVAGLFATGGIGAIAMAPIFAAAATGLKLRADALGKKMQADRIEAEGGSIAEVQKLRDEQRAFQKKASFTTFSGVSGLIAGWTTRRLQKNVRAKAEADIMRRDAKGNIGAVGVGDLRDADQFAALARDIERAYASVKQADAQLATATVVGSVVGGAAVGAGYGALVHGANSMIHHDSSTVSVNEHQPVVHPSSRQEPLPTPVPVPGGSEQAPVVAVPTSDIHTVPIQPDGLLAGATIHRPGEGFGEMVQEFKHVFRQQLPVIDKPSPALAHVLNSNPNDIAHELLVSKDGTSLTMQPGDQFIADEHQNIWFQPSGGEPQLVYENDPTAPGGFIHHDIHGHMQGNAVHTDVPASDGVRAAGSQGESPVQEDPSAALNRAQIGGRALDADTAGAQPDDVAASGDTQTSPAEPLVTQTPKPPVAVTAEHPAAPASAAEQSASVAPTAPVDALPQDMTPFTNSHGVDVIPSEPRVYALEGQRLVIWGTDSFKKQLDATYAFIAEQRELGRHATVLLERTRENPFTGARETTMYEFNTDVEALKEFPPDELPIKPFGAQDFVPK